MNSVPLDVPLNSAQQQHTRSLSRGDSLTAGPGTTSEWPIVDRISVTGSATNWNPQSSGALVDRTVPTSSVTRPYSMNPSIGATIHQAHGNMNVPGGMVDSLPMQTSQSHGKTSNLTPQQLLFLQQHQQQSQRGRLIFLLSLLSKMLAAVCFFACSVSKTMMYKLVSMLFTSRELSAATTVPELG